MKVYVLRGGSGCGKSTWARRTFPKSITVSSDSFFTDPDTGAYHFEAARLHDAHNSCFISFMDMVQDDHFIEESSSPDPVENETVLIVDNTNTAIAEFSPYVGVAQAYGHDVRVLTFVYDPVAAYKRNKHGTPLKKCIEMHSRLIAHTELIPKWWPHDYVLWDDTWPYANV